MVPDLKSAFERTIHEQIAVNRARTPTQRFLALCELLDAVHAMAPKGEEARKRRLRALAIKKQERERSHAEIRRLFAAYRTNASKGV